MPGTFAHPGHSRSNSTAVIFRLRGTAGSRARRPLAGAGYAVAITDGATPARTD
ncbi:hypothetical protein AB4Z38_16275 [Arthrobacter sp. 2RAF6]|uniref:hypothetical protein n=1 Tax=Arthrobacter sp. 2RAF6 TaxID=3233002 RepID=UPI003F8DDDBB